MISKENGSSFRIGVFPPEESPKVRPTQEQMQKALKDAMKDFLEIDLPELEKKYHSDRTDLSKILINK